jgi:hypothetical protein
MRYWFIMLALLAALVVPRVATADHNKGVLPGDVAPITAICWDLDHATAILNGAAKSEEAANAAFQASVTEEGCGVIPQTPVYVGEVIATSKDWEGTVMYMVTITNGDPKSEQGRPLYAFVWEGSVIERPETRQAL